MLHFQPVSPGVVQSRVWVQSVLGAKTLAAESPALPSGKLGVSGRWSNQPSVTGLTGLTLVPACDLPELQPTA